MSMSKAAFARIGAFAAVLLGMLAFNGASAFAAGAPIVTSSAATGVSLYGATLNGTVNPNGATTTYKFEYGTTTSYGTSTSVQTAPGEASVSAAIAALSPETTYHYRISATNSFGTSYGSDQSLKTRGWSVGGKRLSELGGSATYKTQGTFSIASAIGEFATPVSISCTETGEGTLGGSSTLSMSSCVVSEPSGCTLKPFTVSLNSVMSGEKNVGTLEFSGGGCTLPESIDLRTNKSGGGAGFFANTGFEKVQQAVTLEGRGVTLGAWKATITNTSTWHLTGANEGGTLGLGWHIEGTPLLQLESEDPTHPATFLAGGTATFQFTKIPVTITCKVSGSGLLSGSKEFALSQCEQKGWVNCFITNATPIKLKGFSPESGKITTFETSGCPGNITVTGGAFAVTAGAEKTELPVSLFVAANAEINVEINSTWFLNGKYINKKFGAGPS